MTWDVRVGLREGMEARAKQGMSGTDRLRKRVREARRLVVSLKEVEHPEDPQKARDAQTVVTDVEVQRELAIPAATLEDLVHNKVIENLANESVTKEPLMKQTQGVQL